VIKKKNQQLADLVAPQSSGEIKFVVVAEPPEDQQQALNCVDVGYATVNAKKLLRDESDYVEKRIDVHGMEDESEVVGQMNVTVSIVQALKKVQNYHRIQT